MAAMKRAILGAAFAVLALVFASNVAARSGAAHGARVTTVPRGFDLYQTDPEQNFFKFVGRAAIPAGFFTSDSQSFEGSVNFGGDPIIKFQGTDVGNADTVGERTADGAPGPGGAAGDAVPFELRALSLVSVAPIEVQTGHGPELWDVRATLSPSRPSTGSLRIRQTDPNGGTVDSQATVYPMFTLTRLSDGAVKTIDVGALPDGSRPDEPIIGQATPWRGRRLAPAPHIPPLHTRLLAPP